MSEKYELRKNEDEDIEGCDCCGAEVPTSLFKGMSSERSLRGGKTEDYWLCEICANTHLSKALFYPSQCSDITLYKSIALIANMILQKLQTPPSETLEEVKAICQKHNHPGSNPGLHQMASKILKIIEKQ